MGFLDYAWSISCQKQKEKIRICVDPALTQPSLEKDEKGFNVSLPVPTPTDQETISYLGYEFPSTAVGKQRAGRLFRACVLHLTAHTLTPVGDEITFLSTTAETPAEAFSESLVNDVCVHTYLHRRQRERLADLAYANSLAYSRIKPVDRIFNPATRIMTALLLKATTGVVKGQLASEEEKIVRRMTKELGVLEKKASETKREPDVDLNQDLQETAANIAELLERNGPILEAPSLPHTEQLGPCTIFSQHHSSDPEVHVFGKSLERLGSPLQPGASVESCWKKEWNAEALQAYISWEHQKSREKKILDRINQYVEPTRLKSVGFPAEDYAQYRRARLLLSGGSRRLLDSLRVAQDALDEDPRKEMGQLDLSEVIQKVASQSPRTDVFMQNEYLSKSYAWSILYDVSASMRAKGELGRALAICIAEATKELLMDPGSWTFLAFSDRLYVVKDASEAYSHKVRARIGGIQFDGLTYMPDAIQVAGKMLAKRFDEQRFLVVISDGWPYGYRSILEALSESVNSLRKKGVIVIGLGVDSDRMGEVFRISCSVSDQKDLIKKFAKIYVQASAAALEA